LTDNIIIVEHLSHSYQTGSIRKEALVDINLEIKRGSCAAIIGITGSGKTMLIQHFNGLLRPNSGQVIVDGIAVHKMGVNMQQLRQRVGMLFQFPEAQLFAPTVYADVAYGPQRLHLDRHEVRVRVRAALEQVGLPPNEFASRSPFALSGGQQRRVALAGVLSMQPSILVLDEPTVGLDAGGRAEFYGYLRTIQREQGVTTILVSHDMTEVAEMADTIFVLSEGRLVMRGSPQTIFAQADQLHAYGLATPPLSELLMHLRQRGYAVPADIFTLDQAFTWLTQQLLLSNGHFHAHKQYLQRDYPPSFEELHS
jgi:energy-coupling factor transport system ATP-binding protein